MAEKECYTILKTVFDNIFELDFAEKTLRCICSTEYVLFCSADSIRMYMDDALNTWLNSEVYPEDREKMEELFQSAADAGADNRSLRVQFRMGAGGQSEQNEYAWYFGEIIRLSGELCCFGFNKIEEQKAISILNHTESVPPARSGPAVKVITFGYFDVFVNNKPVLFISEKAKELFALLIDRRGGYVSSSEAISMLWEDEPYDEKTRARYRKTAFNLRKTLEEYGIEDILESKNGKRRIDPEKVRCDLYDYLTGDSQFASMFRGMYMLNYSWGEVTLSNLTGGY